MVVTVHHVFTVDTAFDSTIRVSGRLKVFILELESLRVCGRRYHIFNRYDRLKISYFIFL